MTDEWKDYHDWEILAGDWDDTVVEIKYADGRIMRATYGYEDESWDPESGDEYIYSCWHDEVGRVIETPDFYRPITDV